MFRGYSQDQLDVLKRAKALIDTPEKWTKFKPCADENDNRCIDDDAVKFCAYGAMDQSIGQLGFNNVIGLRTEVEIVLSHHIPGSEIKSITDFNDEDGTTHTDIMMMYDSAINEVKGNL